MGSTCLAGRDGERGRSEPRRTHACPAGFRLTGPPPVPAQPCAGEGREPATPDRFQPLTAISFTAGSHPRPDQADSRPGTKTALTPHPH